MCKCGNAFSLLVLIGRAAWPQNNWHNRTNNGSVLVSKLNLKHETPKTNLQFSVAIARRQHPFPSRTRKLSSSAPMVLPGKLGGRVGRRRNFFKTRNHILIPGFLILTFILNILLLQHSIIPWVPAGKANPSEPDFFTFKLRYYISTEVDFLSCLPENYPLA
jgi:hypothetical protein